MKRVLYKGIFIEYNKTELVNIKTSLFLREKRRFLWPGLRKECSCDQIDFLKGLSPIGTQCGPMGLNAVYGRNQSLWSTTSSDFI